MTIAFVACQWRSNTPLYYTCWIYGRKVTVKASGATALEAYQRAIDLLTVGEG